MPAQLDVYRDWLQIKETNRPLSYYQLLRLKQFEDDLGKVREHYRKMNAHVRKYAAGEFAKQSQALLNELSKAMLCLTDTKRKGEYDASLGRKSSSSGKLRTMEEILLARKILEPDQLAKARNFANAVGVEVRDAIVQQKLAKPEDVMPAYAESIGLPYVDLADVPLDPQILPRVPAMLARQFTILPLMIENEQLLVASSTQLDPNVEEELRLRTDMPIRTVLASPAGLNEVVNKYYTKEAAAAEKAAGPVKSKPAAKPAPAKSEKAATPAPATKEDKKAQKEAEAAAKADAKRQAAEAKAAEKEAKKSAKDKPALSADEQSDLMVTRIKLACAGFALCFMLGRMGYLMVTDVVANAYDPLGYAIPTVLALIGAGVGWMIKRG